MTRQHYERAARLVRLVHPAKARERMVDLLVTLFAENGGRFNEARFREACVPGAPIRKVRKGAKPLPANHPLMPVRRTTGKRKKHLTLVKKPE